MSAIKSNDNSIQNERGKKETSCHPLCLIIMDGLAYGTDVANVKGSAVAQAKTPVLDELYSRWPHSFLEASGKAVGLPAGQMGNSEVGHLNMGAGRVVFQELTRIDNAIETGEFFQNAVLIKAIKKAVEGNRTVHLMGLLSDGGVHSSNQHLYALIKMARDLGALRIALHCFLDGRDTPPKSGVGYLKQLESHCEELDAGHIQTVVGRYYAMDRDNRYERVQRAYDALTLGSGTHASHPVTALEESYQQGITDEFVEPIICGDQLVTDEDTVIFFNFRPDRAREISRAFVDEDFKGFVRARHPQTMFVCLTEYDPTLKAEVAFPKEDLTNVLADVLERSGLRQLHIAETEKYAHVTFFFNGGVEEPKKNEERTLIPSPKVATYDLQPEMSAPAVGDALVKAIENDEADVYIVNFANGDMVGHTGSFDAAVRAVEEVDKQVGRVVDALEAKDGCALITADHGNAEQMLETDCSSPFTAHTCNKVPLIVVNSCALEVKDGALSDIAPTILGLMKICAPDEWTGHNLVVY